jgi:HKD family nuclease
MKKQNVRIVLIENLYEDTIREKLVQQIPDAKIFKLPVAVEGESSIQTNEQLIENLVKTIESTK